MRSTALFTTLVLASALSLGCSQAIFSWTRFQSQSAYTDAAYEAFRERLAAGNVTKSDVFETLGPPLQIVSSDEGDAFVFRRLSRNTRIINLNPAFVSFIPFAPPIPLFFGRSTSGHNDTLMVFFDPEGRLVTEGKRLEILGVGQALFGIGDQRELP